MTDRHGQGRGPILSSIEDEHPYEWTLGNGTITVGRSSSNQCQIRLKSISRTHCTIRSEDGEFWIHDNGSTNGVRVNGRRIERCRLKPWDQVQIADIRFRYIERAEHPGDPVDPSWTYDEKSIQIESCSPKSIPDNGRSSTHSVELRKVRIRLSRTERQLRTLTIIVYSLFFLLGFAGTLLVGQCM